MMDRSVIVIGGTGFIGRRLVRHLTHKGMPVKSFGSKELNLEDPADSDRVLGDATREPCSIVYLSVIAKHIEDSYTAFLRNVNMARNLAAGICTRNVQRLIVFSSVDVYGRRPPVPITESSPVCPDGWYALAKCVIENMVTEIEPPGCPVSIVRIPGVYGFGSDSKGVVARFVEAAQRGQPTVLHNGGHAKRDYVYVEDLCEVVDRLLAMPHHGVLNVATGESAPIREIASQAARALGVPAQLVEQPGDDEREFDLVFDNSLLTTLMPGIQLSNVEDTIRAALLPQRKTAHAA